MKLNDKLLLLLLIAGPLALLAYVVYLLVRYWDQMDDDNWEMHGGC